MSSLCVAIFVRSIAQAKRDVALAFEAGADLVELRVDSLEYPNAELDQLIRDVGPRCILTRRAGWEGGENDESDAQRIAFFDSVPQTGRYNDVELRTLRGAPEAASREKRIVSFHDFKGRPDRLYNVIDEMNRTAAGEVNKVAWMARSVRDNLEAFELLLARHKPTIALCMGEAGLISRVLTKKFGGFLTFAGLTGDSVTAPGQLSIHDLKSLYRWDALRGTTRVYGVVGCPIAHSMSPAVHNASFDATGYDGVYVPLLVQPGYESFKAFMAAFTSFAPLEIRGLSVTIPHKENALRYLQENGATIDPLAIEIGAVNTISIDPTDSPALRGANTDYSAIVDSIAAALGIEPRELSGRRVAVIGAGGTGRTAVAALARLGATVVVYNRTRDRADALAAEFTGRTGKVVAAELAKLCDSCCEIYINTTSIGMSPDADASPFGERVPDGLTKDSLVFDTVYNPSQTRFLRQAADAGAKTVGGIEMFVRQAASQFELWTGKSAPSDVMRRTIESRLAV